MTNGTVVARHGASHDAHQQHWDEFVPQGYRPICLSVYGDRTNPRYASVWVKRAGPAFVGIHGADRDGF